jgi:hypothetical protein
MFWCIRPHLCRSSCYWASEDRLCCTFSYVCIMGNIHQGIQSNLGHL